MERPDVPVHGEKMIMCDRCQNLTACNVHGCTGSPAHRESVAEIMARAAAQEAARLPQRRVLVRWEIDLPQSVSACEMSA